MKSIKVKDELIDYALEIVSKTRKHKLIELGASPRASLALLDLAKAIALIDGEDFVRPKSIYEIAQYVLGHRIVLNAEAKYSGVNVESVINEILEQCKTPTN